MKKTLTIVSLIINVLIFLLLGFVAVNVVVSLVGVADWPVETPWLLEEFTSGGENPVGLVYSFAYVGGAFLLLAAIGQIVLDIVRLAKPETNGKFWVYCKNSATVVALSSAVFTLLLWVLRDVTGENALSHIGFNLGDGSIVLLIVAPVLALVSGLFTEYLPKTPFWHTVLLPLGTYLYVIANVVLSVGVTGFGGYPIFAVTDNNPVWMVALVAAIIAVASYILGAIYWLLQAAMRKATSPEPSLVVEEVKEEEEAPAETVEETVPTAVEEEPTEEPVPETTEEPTPETAEESKQEEKSAEEEPTPEPTPVVDVAPAKKKIIIVRKPNKELADAYREEPLIRERRVSTRKEEPVIQAEESVSESETASEITSGEEPKIKKSNVATYNDRPRVYHVSKQSDSGRWQVKLATGVKAIRLFDTQEEAIMYAKGLVKTMGGSIRVHSVKGKMRKH